VAKKKRKNGKKYQLLRVHTMCVSVSECVCIVGA